MTLAMADVVRQLPSVVTRYRDELAMNDRGLALARAALHRWESAGDEADAQIADAMRESARPFALSFRGEAPTMTQPASPFAPACVVAADGSSIEPDRFAPVPCFVISIGAIVLPYGVPGVASMESRAAVGPFATGEDEGPDAGGDSAGRGWGVDLQRDARELERGAWLAHERSLDSEVVLILDGTLFPWDLDAPHVSDSVKRDARMRTQDALDLLHSAGERVCLGAYVSGSRSGDVVASLGALAPEPLPAWPATDAQLFARLLREGERSALFRAMSERRQRVEQLFSPAHEVCFFYLRIGADVARVELPHWAATPARVDRLHATLVDQCRRCDGYPRALQEAHELAVISGGDRQLFSRLLEEEAARQGIHQPATGKQQSKRRRAV